MFKLLGSFALLILYFWCEPTISIFFILLYISMKNLDNILSLIVGILSVIIVIYRIVYIMIPMIKNAIIKNDIYEIFKSFTLLI